MTDTPYCTKAPLTVAPAHLRREIGVSVIHIPHHAGLNGPASSIERETVTLHTVALGSIVAADVAESAITEATERTIADLDAAITELCAHRMRLANEYRRRAGSDPDASGASPILREFIASEARQRRLEALLSGPVREALAGTQEHANRLEAEGERPLMPADLLGLIHSVLSQIAALEPQP